MASTASPSTHPLGSMPSAMAQDRHVAKRKSLFARFFDALVAARQREADRIIANAIAQQGGRFTDALERRIEQRVL